MKTLLRIQNYKRISEEIKLKDFESVNYFVGRNNSGKSSILNALSHLNDGVNSRRFFGPDSIIEFITDNGKQFIVWEEKEKNPNHTSHRGNLQLIIVSLAEQHSEMGANGTLRSDFNYIKIGKAQLDYINETAVMLNISPIVAQRIIKNDDPWDNLVGERIFLQENREVLLQFLANGLKSFNDLRFSLTQTLGQLSPDQIRKADAIIVLIEEPENNLHPDMQKAVPVFLDSFIKNSDSELRSKVCFCISTHSPFIIGASTQFKDQKVYLVDDGHLVDLQKQKIMTSTGYKGHECAWVVGQMLGGSVTDFGYPENYIILEEYSLQLILDDAKRKNLISNIQFISASGVTRIISLTETINEIKNLNTLIKCNPYYVDKYLIILDNTMNLGKKEFFKLSRIKDKLGNRFVELSNKVLEEYYMNIDPTIYQEFMREAKTASGQEMGLLKAKYAAIVTKKLNTSEDFSKLFNKELDFLLK